MSGNSGPTDFLASVVFAALCAMRLQHPDPKVQRYPLRVLFVFVVGLLTAACANQQGLSSNQIDALATAAMQEFQVPGAVIGVIKDGEIVHASGYGVRELGLPGEVDGKTLFRIASLTKSMTSAALATLVNDGQLNWDDKVVEHIPEFQMFYPWLTEQFTVTDLLTHRSGLKPHAGDLMLWPSPNSFTRADIIHNLRYFRPVRDFRAHYDYDNLLYVVAGELLPAIVGQQWSEVVDQRLLGSLGAKRCFAGHIPATEMVNLAAPHAMIDEQLQVIERNRIKAAPSVSAAAGGVRCSLEGVLKWAQLQLDQGALADGSRLFSADVHASMWSPKTILKVSDTEAQTERMHFKAYGLGWRLADAHGYKRVSHTGSFTGSNNWLVLVPELRLGVVVMLNASAGAARSAIMKSIVDAYLGAPKRDWVDYYRQQRKLADSRDDLDDQVHTDFRDGTVSAPLSAYAGEYSDPWFGKVSITQSEEGLWFASAKSPKLSGRLWPLKDHTFMVRWEDRSAERDVLLDFVFEKSDVASGFDIRCLAESIPCSFVDQEMGFSRVTLK